MPNFSRIRRYTNASQALQQFARLYFHISILILQWLKCKGCNNTASCPVVSLALCVPSPQHSYMYLLPKSLRAAKSLKLRYWLGLWEDNESSIGFILSVQARERDPSFLVQQALYFPCRYSNKTSPHIALFLITAPAWETTTGKRERASFKEDCFPRIFFNLHFQRCKVILTSLLRPDRRKCTKEHTKVKPARITDRLTTSSTRTTLPV